mmetsp:Transcript_26325/g.69169  ORF Transcript_26325/g.69169 Transcript_26325/m.69169 type:complete len:271 (-) Transcript_26325:92-904(-)
MAPKWSSMWEAAPPYMIWPLAIRITLSKASKISDDGWCSTLSTVHPSSASLRSSLTVSRAANESRPDVGSSRKMVRGCVISSTPMAVRFFSPPETPRRILSPMMVSAHPLSLSLSSISSTSWVMVPGGVEAGSRSRAEKVMASLGVTVANIESSWVTYATSVLARSRVSGLPSRVMAAPGVSPDASDPHSTLKMDVLPAPDGPMMHATWPGRHEPEQSVRMVLRPLRPETVRVTLDHTRPRAGAPGAAAPAAPSSWICTPICAPRSTSPS